MGTYLTAEACPNGHVSTSRIEDSPELREQYCSKCGEETMTQCPNCDANIRGHYDVEGVLILGGQFEPPAHCHNCGRPFPWTERRIDAAAELLEAGGAVSADEVQQFRADLDTLTKETPKTQAASLRVKAVLGKAGDAVATGVREIVVDVLSEAAKKAIWG
jgi:hypothetical protein